MADAASPSSSLWDADVTVSEPLDGEDKDNTLRAAEQEHKRNMSFKPMEPPYFPSTNLNHCDTGPLLQQPCPCSN